MSALAIPTSGKAPQILDAAEQMFGRLGFEGVSMSALADEAGVSKANIFHHFKSKEELYLTVLHRARRRFVSDLLMLSNGHTGSEQRLHALSKAYLRQMLENEPLVRLMMRELFEKRRPGKHLAERLFADNFAELVALIDEGQSRGELRADFNAGMAMLIISAVSVHYLQTREFMRHLPGMEWTEDSERLADALWDILWRGIAPRT